VSVLKDSQSTLTGPKFVGADGETPADTASLPVCTVTRENGTALTAAVVTNLSDNGIYTAAITTAHTALLDRLVLVWTGTATLAQTYTQHVEVAGGWYVTIPEVRDEPDLSLSANYSTDAVRRMRDRFEKLAEDFCSVAFVPRYNRVSLYGNGGTCIMLPHTQLRDVVSVTIDGTPVASSAFELNNVTGLVRTDGSSLTRPAANAYNLIVEYTHGYDYPPADLKEACLEFIRSKLTGRRAGFPNAAQDSTMDGNQVTFGQAGPDRPTGIASVDEVLNRLNETIPGVA